MRIIPHQNIDSSLITVTNTATSLFTLMNTAGSVANSSDYFLNSNNGEGRPADGLLIRPEDGNIRIALGGVTPTASKGFFLSAGTLYTIPNIDLSRVNIIKTGASNVLCSVEIFRSNGRGAVEGISDSVTLEGTTINVGNVTTNNEVIATKDNQTNGEQKIQIVDIAGNPINSTQKLDGTYALDVFTSDTKDSLINVSFIQDTATTTTISTPASAGATQITVVDGSGFLVGNDLTITEGLKKLDNHFKVTAKPSANVITLDMPIDIDLTTSAVVTKVLDSMNVSGSLASPQIFTVKPPADETWHITRLLFTMTDQTAMDDALFGGITALTNGLVLRKKVSGVYSTHANFKANGKFADSMYDITYADKAPSGFYGIRGRWTIEKSGSIIRLDGANGDELEFIVQDNLTGLDKIHWVAQGHIQ